jgi:hypothetical protein
VVNCAAPEVFVRDSTMDAPETFSSIWSCAGRCRRTERGILAAISNPRNPGTWPRASRRPKVPPRGTGSEVG